MLRSSRTSASAVETSRDHSWLRVGDVEARDLRLECARAHRSASITGRPATSAMRSSSVAPRGSATVVSHVSLPSSMSSAMSLPLG
jgi:hypothetical protein